MVVNSRSDRIQCAVAFGRRLERHVAWNRRFQADLLRDPGVEGKAGRVRSYAHYLDGHEWVYGTPLSSAGEAALIGSQAYRAGAVQSRIEVPELLEMLRGHVALLGAERKLHIRALAERLDDRSIERFIGDLYRLCDDVWRRLLGERVSYVIWNVVLRKDGVGLEPPKAMSWHYDTHYPKRYLKFLIGLNASEEHGGGTELLTPEDSARFTDRTGYVGYRANERTAEDSFVELATERRIVFRPNLGDVLTFWPSRVLHRGLMPSKGQRLMLFVSACPISKPLASGRSRVTRTAFASARETETGYDMPIWWGLPARKPDERGTEVA